MVLIGNKVKRLSSANQITKTTHYLDQKVSFGTYHVKEPKDIKGPQDKNVPIGGNPFNNLASSGTYASSRYRAIFDKNWLSDTPELRP